MTKYTSATLPSDGIFWTIIHKVAEGHYMLSFEYFATKEGAEKQAAKMHPSCEPQVIAACLGQRYLVEVDDEREPSLEGTN